MTQLVHAIRENRFLAYFTRHRVAANLLMAFVILMGIMGLTRLNTQIFPDVSPGMASVSVSWSGTGAQAILDRVTEPLEREIMELDDVDRVDSNTSEGGALLTVVFNAGADVDAAMAELRSTVDDVTLPSDADSANVEQITFAEPVMFVVFSYDESVEDLRPLLYDVERQLNRRGIPDVDVQGLETPTINIEVTPETLAVNQWTLSELSDEIGGMTDRFTAGQSGEDHNERTLVTGQRVLTGLDLAQLRLGENRLLGDIAEIQDQVSSPSRRLVFEDRNAVLLELSRAKGMDSRDVSGIYREWHNEVVPTLPDSVDVYIFGDNSEFVEDNVSLLVTNGFYGLILVLLTLFLFLNLRVAFWTAMGIPVALFGTMALLYFTGGTLNFFSMFAMLMALGIIVDNAIVVGEETQSMIERGVDKDSAASLAVSRMYAPIIASSLTTIAAFSPLLFVPGVFGELLRPIPIVIIAVIVAALVECFLILPGHLHMSFARSSGRAKTGLRTRIDNAVDKVREDYYRPFIHFMLKQRLISVCLATGLMIISLGMVGGGIVPFSQDIQIEAEEIFADVTFVDGATRADVTAFVERMREGLEATDRHFSDNGEGLIRDFYYEYDLDAGTAFFMARLPSPDDRDFSNTQFLAEWDSRVERTQAVDRMRIESESGGGAGASELNLRLAGDDPEALRAGTDALTQALTQISELRNIEDNLPATNRQLRLDLTPRARALGMTEQRLAGQVAGAVNGVTVRSFTQFGEEVDIRLRLSEEARQRLDMVSWLPIRLDDGSTTALSDLADFVEQEEPSAISRRDGRETVIVTADGVSDEVDMQALQASIQQTIMPDILTQYGLDIDYATGESAAELLDNLVVAAWAALALMYLILAWMFQSYTWPLAVMTSIPFAMTGAIFGHWIMGLDLNFLSIFGLFGLAGIVINGSIILISRFRELLEEGADRQTAIVEASCQRFRPVVLTTLTTVMGLIPILLETSVQAQLIRSMATSLAFGLGYGAVLVLLVIPCVLSFVQSGGTRVNQFMRWIMPQRAS